ncbi:hypothetical protein HanRHA438_Chr17g0795481 [Helianthus annuus]|nr:hypothetical protein HanIR_Chr17g0852061 [Helianthus annuus]KAJ0824724.1 hypothetical protein HanRHA438_Chr17g0795481 [Helianthus annuus]
MNQMIIHGMYCTDLPSVGVLQLRKLTTSQCCLAVSTHGEEPQHPNRALPGVEPVTSRRGLGGTGQLGYPRRVTSDI